MANGDRPDGPDEREKAADRGKPNLRLIEGTGFAGPAEKPAQAVERSTVPNVVDERQVQRIGAFYKELVAGIDHHGQRFTGLAQFVPGKDALAQVDGSLRLNDHDRKVLAKALADRGFHIELGAGKLAIAAPNQQTGLIIERVSDTASQAESYRIGPAKLQGNARIGFILKPIFEGQSLPLNMDAKGQFVVSSGDSDLGKVFASTAKGLNLGLAAMPAGDNIWALQEKGRVRQRLQPISGGLNGAETGAGEEVRNPEKALPNLSVVEDGDLKAKRAAAYDPIIASARSMAEAIEGFDSDHAQVRHLNAAALGLEKLKLNPHATGAELIDHMKEHSAKAGITLSDADLGAALNWVEGAAHDIELKLNPDATPREIDPVAAAKAQVRQVAEMLGEGGPTRQVNDFGIAIMTAMEAELKANQAVEPLPNSPDRPRWEIRQAILAATAKDHAVDMPVFIDQGGQAKMVSPFREELLEFFKTKPAFASLPAEELERLIGEEANKVRKTSYEVGERHRFSGGLSPEQFAEQTKMRLENLDRAWQTAQVIFSDESSRKTLELIKKGIDYLRVNPYVNNHELREHVVPGTYNADLARVGGADRAALDFLFRVEHNNMALQQDFKARFVPPERRGEKADPKTFKWNLNDKSASGVRDLYEFSLRSAADNSGEDVLRPEKVLELKTATAAFNALISEPGLSADAVAAVAKKQMGAAIADYARTHRQDTFKAIATIAEHFINTDYKPTPERLAGHLNSNLSFSSVAGAGQITYSGFLPEVAAACLELRQRGEPITEASLNEHLKSKVDLAARYEASVANRLLSESLAQVHRAQATIGYDMVAHSASDYLLQRGPMVKPVGSDAAGTPTPIDADLLIAERAYRVATFRLNAADKGLAELARMREQKTNGEFVDKPGDSKAEQRRKRDIREKLDTYERYGYESQYKDSKRKAEKARDSAAGQIEQFVAQSKGTLQLVEPLLKTADLQAADRRLGRQAPTADLRPPGEVSVVDEKGGMQAGESATTLAAKLRTLSDASKIPVLARMIEDTRQALLVQAQSESNPHLSDLAKLAQSTDPQSQARFARVMLESLASNVERGVFDAAKVEIILAQVEGRYIQHGNSLDLSGKAGIGIAIMALTAAAVALWANSGSKPTYVPPDRAK